MPVVAWRENASGKWGWMDDWDSIAVCGGAKRGDGMDGRMITARGSKVTNLIEKDGERDGWIGLDVMDVMDVMDWIGLGGTKERRMQMERTK